MFKSFNPPHSATFDPMDGSRASTIAKAGAAVASITPHADCSASRTGPQGGENGLFLRYLGELRDRCEATRMLRPTPKPDAVGPDDSAVTALVGIAPPSGAASSEI